MNIRIRINKFLIGLNENIFFYPKLSSFYKQKKIKNGKPIIIFDIGANKGQTIDFFSKLYKNIIIHAFEPNPKLYKKIEKKYRNKKNIFIHNLGVSNINGQLELKETVTDETSTFENLNYDSEYLNLKAKILGVKKEEIVNKKYFVNVIRLSDFIEKEFIKKINILKIDTEGHELKCLLGLSSENFNNIDFIQLERHDDDMYLSNDSKSEILDLLNINGYKICTEIKHGFGDFKECIYEK